MLDSLISFVKRLPGGQPGRPRGSADDPRIAAAALMFHVVNADGVLQESEKTKLRWCCRKPIR